MMNLHSSCRLFVCCLLILISDATTCTATTSDVIQNNPTFMGESNGHKWRVESIELDDNLIYDVEIINGDKINDTNIPPPLVLIHGWMDSRLSWIAIKPHLLTKFNNDQIIILPTLRGHGDSQIFPLENSSFSLEEYVGDIVLLLNKIGFNIDGTDKFHFVGHSMGSIITMQAVISYPKLIKSAVFMNGVPKIQSKPRFNFDAEKGEPTLSQKLGITRKTHDPQVEKGWISKEFADILMRENLKVTSIAMRESYKTLYKMNLNELLINTFNANPNIQSMVMFGENDFFPSSQQMEYAQSIGTRQKNIISYEDCGHDTIYRYPSDIADKIHDFVMNTNKIDSKKKVKLSFDPNECKWDDPDTPINERDIYGRARFIYDNKTKLIESLSVISKYKVYDLGIKEYKKEMSIGWGRNFETKFKFVKPIGDNNVIYSQQSVYSDALGNVGTQLDGLGQIFYEDDNNNLVWYNNFTQINRDYGVERLGVETMKPIISRAILLDFAGLYNVETVSASHIITVNDIENALKRQGMSTNDILWGDILLFHTGHGKLAEKLDPDFWNFEPGPCLDVIDFAVSRGVVMLGSDSGAMEPLPSCVDGLFIPVHQKWITCHGGLITELMRFDDWLFDARNDIAPWIGTYIQLPIHIKGAVGSPGSPIVIV